MSEFRRFQPPVFPVERVVIPEPVVTTLDNGIPYFINEAGTEEIMRLEFTFRAGQIKEELPLQSSAASMMLTEGSQNYTSEELNRILDYYGIFLNQYSEKDRAGITLYFLTKHTEKAVELSREIIFNPLFSQNELESLMKKRLSWYLINKEKVNNLAADTFFESIFGNAHPYGKQVTEQDFESITSSDVSRFHKANYTPGNMAIFVSGKVHKSALDILNRYFGDLKPDNYKHKDLIIPPKPAGNKKVHITKKGSVQSAIRIGSATINKRHPDYTGFKVLDSILGGYFGSRLMKNIREEKGYTYGINSSLMSFDQSGYKSIYTEVGRKYLRKSLDEIYREIYILQTEHVSESELDLVRNFMSGEMLRMFDGPFALAESYRSVWEFGLDNTYYHRLAEKIRTITSDEIIRLAQTYYNMDDLFEITAG